MSQGYHLTIQTHLLGINCIKSYLNAPFTTYFVFWIVDAVNFSEISSGPSVSQSACMRSFSLLHFTRNDRHFIKKYYDPCLGFRGSYFIFIFLILMHKGSSRQEELNFLSTKGGKRKVSWKLYTEHLFALVKAVQLMPSACMFPQNKKRYFVRKVFGQNKRKFGIKWHYMLEILQWAGKSLHSYLHPFL